MLNTIETNILHFKISKPLDPIYYESKIKYDEFQDKYPFIFLNEERFFEYIVYCVESKEFEMKIKEDSLNLEFTFESGIGKFIEKIKFNINLEKHTGDVKENLSEVASYVKNLENQYESFKNSIEVKFADLEEKLSINIKKFMDEVIIKNKAHEDEIKNNFKNFVENEKTKLDIKRLDIVNEIKLHSVKLNSVNYSNSSLFGFQQVTKIYPKFIDPGNQKVSLSNENRTIEKLINTSWTGVRCEEIPSIPGIYQFSIQIDKTDNNCYIMLGFCLNTHNGAAGYYNGNCLGNFYLTNGYVYSPSISAVPANNFRGVNGIIVSATIDTNLKIIYFSMNGFLITVPRTFRLNDGDISKICPCVDIYTLGDKVSLITI
jgi:hypothetical protein